MVNRVWESVYVRESTKEKHSEEIENKNLIYSVKHIFIQKNYYAVPKRDFKPGAMTREIIVINLIKMLRDGPEVSLNGSPTVSPTTHALCASEPFFCVSPESLSTSMPASTYFFAL